MTYPQNVREAAAKAADWLEANPDKHITGHAVLSRTGNSLINPQSRSAACFCAIGRLAREAGLAAVEIDGEYTPVDELLGSTYRTVAMYGRNDSSKIDGIAALREVAEDKEIAR